MRHSFYASDRNAKTAHKTGQALNQSRSGNYQRPDRSDRGSGVLGATHKDKILITRLKSLYTRYKEDPEKIEEIRSAVSLFEINRGIARQYGDKRSEKERTKEFIEYLNTLEKR